MEKKEPIIWINLEECDHIEFEEPNIDPDDMFAPEYGKVIDYDFYLDLKKKYEELKFMYDGLCK